MTRLQGIDEAYPLFVTLNPSSEVSADDVYDRHVFHHPVFDAGAIVAQSTLRQLQGQSNTWYCGAYMRHGFHEDGLVSALRVVDRLGCRPDWAKLD
jgi:predicted NAD/FAD-binding protein